MNERTLSIPIPTDEEGMVGRTCPDLACNRYFKVKIGTGLDITFGYCPYCKHAADASEFLTADQKQRAISVAMREIVDPLLRGFGQSLKRLNMGSSRDAVQIRVDTRFRPTQLHSYVERELETRVTCDNCGLEFAVYGVFASCPDCQRLNALTTLLASLETARKRIHLANNDELDSDLRERLPRDSTADAVSAFDAYGKALRAAFPDVIRDRAKSNLFQDLESLDRELETAVLPDVASLAGEGLDRIRWLFQVRHLYQHNAGVVDDRFIGKMPSYAAMKGRLLRLPHADVLSAIDELEQLARKLDVQFTEWRP